MEFLIKAIIGGLVIAGVVTAAERGNPTMGALILGIPLGSVISVIFIILFCSFLFVIYFKSLDIF